jgi:hypothetical protein
LLSDFSLGADEVGEVGGVEPSEDDGRVFTFGFRNRSGECFGDVLVEAVDEVEVLVVGEGLGDELAEAVQRVLEAPAQQLDFFLLRRMLRWSA